MCSDLKSARALVNKGVTLGKLDLSAEEIEVYDAVIARYGDATEPALSEKVTQSEIRLANILIDTSGDRPPLSGLLG
jgi:hypothetical protein